MVAARDRHNIQREVRGFRLKELLYSSSSFSKEREKALFCQSYDCNIVPGIFTIHLVTCNKLLLLDFPFLYYFILNFLHSSVHFNDSKKYHQKMYGRTEGTNAIYNEIIVWTYSVITV